MISVHSSMPSSQMYTPGPATSLRTCSWDLPQKEHFSFSPSPKRNIRSRVIPESPHTFASAYRSRAIWPFSRGFMMSSTNPYSFAAWASIQKSRSVSCSRRSIGCPVCLARISFTRARNLRNCFACISISAVLAPGPPPGLWVGGCGVGRGPPFPFAPPRPLTLSASLRMTPRDLDRVTSSGLQQVTQRFPPPERPSHHIQTPVLGQPFPHAREILLQPAGNVLYLAIHLLLRWLQPFQAR